MGIESVEEVHDRWKREQRENCPFVKKDQQACESCAIIRCRSNPKYDFYDNPQIN